MPSGIYKIPLGIPLILIPLILIPSGIFNSTRHIISIINYYNNYMPSGIYRLIYLMSGTKLIVIKMPSGIC